MSKLEIQTPKGTFRYPHISKADMKFAKDADGGKFKTGIIISKKDADPIIKQFKDAAIEEWGSKKAKTAADSFFTDLGDGTISINAETKYRPGVVDSKGVLIENPEKLKIGGGSIGRIKISTNFSQTSDGTKLFLKAFLNGVQITKLVAYGSGGPQFAPDEDDDEDAFVAGDQSDAGGDEAPGDDTAPAADKPKDATGF